MTLKEAVIKAVTTNNLVMVEQVLDQLYGLGFNYEDCANFFKKHCGLDEEQFEGFCYEIDCRERE